MLFDNKLIQIFIWPEVNMNDWVGVLTNDNNVKHIFCLFTCLDLLCGIAWRSRQLVDYTSLKEFACKKSTNGFAPGKGP